ncbi:MAG: transposase [Planctomycetes bacterium]|nr:transposase [Planctomycetota bacterium]
MARKRFKPEEIVAILREAERLGSVQEVIRKHGISDQTFYRWRKMYGGTGAPELAKLKKLEAENTKLKQLAGDQALAIQTLKEVLGKKGWA